jgi:hypothetical protein
LGEEDTLEENEFDYLSKIKPKGLRNLRRLLLYEFNFTMLLSYKRHYFLKNKTLIKKKNGPITTGLLDLIEGLSKKDSYSYYIPEKFKQNLIKEYNSFEGSEGKDSGDLVSIILSSCHDELAKESDLADMSLDQRQQSIL